MIGVVESGPSGIDIKYQKSKLSDGDKKTLGKLSNLLVALFDGSKAYIETFSEDSERVGIEWSDENVSRVELIEPYFQTVLNNIDLKDAEQYWTEIAQDECPNKTYQEPLFYVSSLMSKPEDNKIRREVQC